MPTGITLELKKGSTRHKRIIRAVRDRVKASRQVQNKYTDRWKKANDLAVGYIKEKDIDAVRRVSRREGTPEYTTITLPYTYAVIMTAHTYATSVFMGRDPIFQFEGRHGESQQSINAVQSLINYNMVAGNMRVPTMLWLYDTFKYSYSVLGLYWDRQISRVSEITYEDELDVLGQPTGKKKKIQRSRELLGYEGNTVYNVAPQNFLHDPRVAIHDFQKGEYCAVETTISMNRLIEGEAEGYYFNVQELRNKQNASRKHGTTELNYLDQEESGSLGTPDVDDFGTHHTSDDLAADVIKVYEMYIELIPSRWGLGESNFPEKWCVTVTQDYEFVIAARPLGAIHNLFPFAVQCTDFDWQSIYPRDIGTIINPLQNTMDWLFNSHMYNVRKALNNQWLVDPSKVVMGDVTNPLPGGIIRLRPSAYGQDPATAIRQLDVQDVTRAHVSDLGLVTDFAERVHGVNDSMMGQSNPSSRRSAQEVRSENSFSTARLKTVTEYMSHMGWSPLGNMMLANAQQYYDQEMQMRIVGDVATLDQGRFMQVTPEAIAGRYDYVAVDGTLPIDRFAQAAMWRELFGGMVQFPSLMQGYDINKLFGWIAQLMGLKNIDQFRIELAPDEQVRLNQTAGNVVPIEQAEREIGSLPRETQSSGTGPIA